MQSIKWYANRLQAMSGGELVCRMNSAVRDVADHVKLNLGCHHAQRLMTFDKYVIKNITGFNICDWQAGSWMIALADQPQSRWLKSLLAKADMIVDHKLNFFDLKPCDLGDSLDWNCDHKNNKRSPMRFSAAIDYRDFNIVGDAKIVWEPNRHHHLVVLARAYHASGNLRYAREVCSQLDSWIKTCPFGIGMNWRSPLELAVRLINWVVAIDLIKSADVITAELYEQILKSVYLHIWEITRKYSNGSSTNNHLIGEAAGVYIASTYFCQFEKSREWQEQSKDILCREILTQTFPDGAGREQAIGYQCFVCEFYLLVAVIAEKTKQTLPQSFWQRLKAMLSFISALSKGGENLPNFGDSDDGYVLDLGSGHGDYKSLLAIGAVLFKNAEFKKQSQGFSQSAFWLLGQPGNKLFHEIPIACDTSSTSDQITSQAFEPSGLYLLQSGSLESNNQISVSFDAGPQGLPPLSGHGHADALSFTMRVNGQDVLVDPGTYDYFSYPEWRRYFKRTRAHNTIEIDSQDQAVMAGSFMWNPHADAHCLEWKPDKSGGQVVAMHEGYSRLADPVIHKRSLNLVGQNLTLIIRDYLTCKADHKIAMTFQLAEHCKIISEHNNQYEIAIPDADWRITIKFDPTLAVKLLFGSSNPIGGWVSRGYHQKTEAITLIAQTNINKNTILECSIGIKTQKNII